MKFFPKVPHLYLVTTDMVTILLPDEEEEASVENKDTKDRSVGCSVTTCEGMRSKDVLGTFTKNWKN